MRTREKLIERLLSQPRDFTFDELDRLLASLGYTRVSAGKTGGSRVKFRKGSVVIHLHRPHPARVLKPYQVRQLIDQLKREREL